MADAREGAGWFYTHRVSASRKELHAVERVLRVAQALGDEDPRSVIPRADGRVRPAMGREDAGGGASPAPGPQPRGSLVDEALAAGTFRGSGPACRGRARGRARRRRLAGDRPLAEELRRHLGRLGLLDLSGRTSLLQLAAVARHADLFLSNDTGPLHLAAAAGARVVGIYTCTDPRLTGPYGPHATSVRSCVWCAPSFRKRATGSIAWSSSLPTASGPRSGAGCSRHSIWRPELEIAAEGLKHTRPHSFTIGHLMVKMGNLAKGNRIRL